MKAKHRKVLQTIFARPTKANIKFADIESLLIHLGGTLKEGSGSRISVTISGKTLFFHRPHPGKEAKRYQSGTSKRVFAINRSQTMKNSLSYKGFTARIEFDPDDNIFFGRVLGVRDVIGFHGETVKELTTDYHNAIEHYLEVCRMHGETPQKTYSGKLTLRIPSNIHAEIADAAAHAGKSLNKWAAETLEEAVHSP